MAVSESDSLLPTRPYLARAIYQWAVDNHLTPYLLVDAELPSVKVPQQYIQDGQIVLNINPNAIQQFEITNEHISFQARFGGVSQYVYVPLHAVLGLYARENGQGLFFDPEEYKDLQSKIEQEKPAPTRPKLRILE